MPQNKKDFLPSGAKAAGAAADPADTGAGEEESKDAAPAGGADSKGAAAPAATPAGERKLVGLDDPSVKALTLESFQAFAVANCT